ncbi:T9SS type A sorting domain-containing protein [Echinicola strongylocentroti]|nr:T9SS type A sorting domain-containing protein [Echinicola strongylocentroti]
MVHSLSELKPFLDDDDVNVKLAPGTYTITAEDVANGEIGSDSETWPNVSRLLAFEGNNSTYDFTDVKFDIDTEVLQAFGRNDVYELHITGSHNVIQHLTIEDLGNTRPNFRATSIVVDGLDNRLEGIHMTVRGSYPYGYGDAFGKGGPQVIKHYKHSALLVRGESNHIKNCTIIHRAYGHAIFMQAAAKPIIEGCYIEGEVRSTDDMLAEEGTGSPADNVDFMTIWGYKLPAGYVMSLQEEGIRAYNAGQTIVDGTLYKRGTSDPTIINCTVKNVRGGVTLAHASGTKYVEGCTVLSSEQGYSVGSNGNIVDCSADAKYGPVLGFAYSSDNNSTIDIAIIPSDSIQNGAGSLAYVGGSDHKITFRNAESSINQGLKISVSGPRYSVRRLDSTDTNNDLNSSNIEIYNYTPYPLELAGNSADISGESCGPITDNGANNNINNNDCSGALISPWENNDVGTVKKNGRASDLGGLFTIDGAGKDIWDTSDEFHWVYKEMYGDAVITAKVNKLGNTHNWAKAGLMIREEAAGEGSKYAMVGITATKGSVFQFRNTEDGPTSHEIPKDGKATPSWLKLERLGEVITGYISDDGISWKEIGSTSVAMNATVSVGMCATSHKKGTTTTATFRGVRTASPSVHIPQVGKTYYIDNRRWNVRLAADGNNKPYTTSVDSIGAKTEWVVKASDVPEYFYLESNGAPTKSRIASDGIANATMKENTNTEDAAKWEFVPIKEGVYHIVTKDPTLPRLLVDNDGNVKMTGVEGTNFWTRFQFTVVPDPEGKEPLAVNNAAQVNGEKSKAEVAIYPNPVQSELTVKVPSATYHQYVIYDDLGNTSSVGDIPVDSNILSIDVSKLGIGVYMLRLNGVERTDGFKIIKE